MDAGQWILEFIRTQGLAVFLVVGFLLFITFKVWPFWTERVYPDTVRRAELDIDVRREEAAARNSLAAALEAVAVVMGDLAPCPPAASVPATGQGSPPVASRIATASRQTEPLRHDRTGHLKPGQHSVGLQVIQ